MNSRAGAEALYALLGELPDRQRPIAAETLGEERRDGYILERLILDLNGLEPVPAYFVRPLRGEPPYPTVLFNHSHGGGYDVGKEELVAGRSYMASPPYATALAGAGIAALCIDAWNFGERRGRTESELFKEMLWRGRVLWGMMVYDSLRALDYLVSRPDVDTGRIGTLGMSMGSTMAWWVAALDERIAVTVDICCLTDFDALIETRALDAHGIYYYVPGLLRQFSTADINALIAPRPHLSLAGIYDRLTPPQGLDRIDAALRAAYAQAGRPEAWELQRYPVGHVETAAMRRAVFAFLQKWLL
ncbi:MAG TPA: alpha/beta hydrolase family protein [Limnochordia bacterium]